MQICLDKLGTYAYSASMTTRQIKLLYLAIIFGAFVYCIWRIAPGIGL